MFTTLISDIFLSLEKHSNTSCWSTRGKFRLGLMHRQSCVWRSKKNQNLLDVLNFAQLFVVKKHSPYYSSENKSMSENESSNMETGNNIAHVNVWRKLEIESYHSSRLIWISIFSIKGLFKSKRSVESLAFVLKESSDESEAGRLMGSSYTEDPHPSPSPSPTPLINRSSMTREDRLVSITIVIRLTCHPCSRHAAWFCAGKANMKSRSSIRFMWFPHNSLW